MSSGFEVKLDPDERDCHTSCVNGLQPVNPSTFVRLTPNSANCCATRGVLSIPLSPAAMADWFEHPSTSLWVVPQPPTVIPLAEVMTFAPQQGGLWLLMLQVPLLPPMVGLS